MTDQEVLDQLAPLIQEVTGVLAAHSLGDIGSRTTSFFIEEPSLKELRQALRSEQGRTIRV